MPKGVYAAASAMVAEQMQLDATARNLAHLQTTGYHAERMRRQGFATLLADEGRQGGVKGDGGVGVVAESSWYSFGQGVRESTGAPFDVALSGEGFLTVRDAKGKLLLTRNGHLAQDTQGRLVTPEGMIVQGQGGPLVIPPEADRVIIDERGTVTMETMTDAGIVRSQVDQLRLAAVDDPRRMKPINGVTFDPAGLTLRDAAKTTVHQGALERSNVEPIRELVDMIAVQRRYDAAQRSLAEQTRTGDGFTDILRG